MKLKVLKGSIWTSHYAAFFSLLFVVVFTSCNDDDTEVNQPNIDPTLLQKVVFSPGQSNERHWNFHQNGLLKEIANADGTILQSFTYDANNNLIASGGHTFTYNSQNIITTVDEYPVAYSYDAAGGKYTYLFDVPDVEDAGIDFPHKTEIIVNADLLPLTRRIFFNYPEGEIYFTPVASVYLNGNLKTASQQDGDTYQRYEYESTMNPLKAALLPITRAMGLISGNSMFASLGEWHDGRFLSVNNVAERKYALEDPEWNTYSYTYNSLGLPIAQTSQAYDFENPTGAPVTTIQYYYQGDVIP